VIQALQNLLDAPGFQQLIDRRQLPAQRQVINIAGNSCNTGRKCASQAIKVIAGASQDMEQC
jgi:hypothetical protein